MKNKNKAKVIALIVLVMLMTLALPLVGCQAETTPFLDKYSYTEDSSWLVLNNWLVGGASAPHGIKVDFFSSDKVTTSFDNGNLTMHITADKYVFSQAHIEATFGDDNRSIVAPVGEQAYWNTSCEGKVGDTVNLYVRVMNGDKVVACALIDCCLTSWQAYQDRIIFACVFDKVGDKYQDIADSAVLDYLHSLPSVAETNMSVVQKYFHVEDDSWISMSNWGYRVSTTQHIINVDFSDSVMLCQDYDDDSLVVYATVDKYNFAGANDTDITVPVNQDIAWNTSCIGSDSDGTIDIYLRVMSGDNVVACATIRCWQNAEDSPYVCDIIFACVFGKVDGQYQNVADSQVLDYMQSLPATVKGNVSLTEKYCHINNSSWLSVDSSCYNSEAPYVINVDFTNAEGLSSTFDDSSLTVHVTSELWTFDNGTTSTVANVGEDIQLTPVYNCHNHLGSELLYVCVMHGDNVVACAVICNLYIEHNGMYSVFVPFGCVFDKVNGEYQDIADSDVLDYMKSL